MADLVIEGCALAGMDEAGTEHDWGHLVVLGDRIASVGASAAPPIDAPVRRIDGRGCLLTPGLVNTHHHLSQWLTRGLAQNATLFEWLVELYPVWAGIDAELEAPAARAGLAALALSGCTTTTDHHYVHPRGGGDLLAAEIEAARELGLRFQPCRGSMDLGRSAGGLPPDDIVEDRDEILAATAAAIDRWHDPAPGAMLRVAVAPCSPFSVSDALMTESAELARSRGVRLHTHLAETREEEAFCLERFGCRPVEYLADRGWLGDDVWLAHCVHLDTDEVERFGQTQTGVAHCPSSNARLGAGTAPVPALLSADVPVGLGVDGAASNEAGDLAIELRHSLLAARAQHGPAALTTRQALSMATIGGARCLGREDELGSLEPGKIADLALWRLDDLGHAGIDDAVAALVLGPRAELALLTVGGRVVVENGELRTADVEAVAREAASATRRLHDRAGVLS